MGVKEGVDYTSDEILKEIYDCAMTVFCHGIAVPDDCHPCRWSWIDFTEVDDILTYEFEQDDINNNFGDSDYVGSTLKKILIKTEGKFLFEINTYVDWEG